jgi:hypothetical protein
MHVSISIPAYNEAERIEKCVLRVRRFMEKTGKDYEIIIADDGSTDGTDEIARRLGKKFRKIKNLHSAKRLGKGGALKKAFGYSKGDIFIFMDADLATDVSHLKDMISDIDKGFDIVTGSRWIKGSRVTMPFHRHLLSFFYNSLARILFRDGVRDHQCGFKAFRKESVGKIVENVKDNGWFWDTELLVKSKNSGLKIKEIPVTWRENRKSRETRFRILRDSLAMFFKLLRLRFEILKL